MLEKDTEDFGRKINMPVEGLKVAVPNYFMSDIVSDEIRMGIKNVIKFLEENGVIVDYIDMKYLDQAVTLYQVIAMGKQAVT